MLEGNGTVDLVSKLDGNVQNEDSNYDEHFWNEIDRGTTEEIGYLTTKTIPNNLGSNNSLLLQQCVISLTEKQSFLTITKIL